MEDIENAFVQTLDKTPGYSLSLAIQTTFERDNPTDTKTAVGRQLKNLTADTLKREDNCQTMEQLKAFSHLDCDTNEGVGAKILFQQAYQPNLILGATADVYPIIRNVSERGETDP